MLDVTAQLGEARCQLSVRRWPPTRGDRVACRAGKECIALDVEEYGPQPGGDRRWLQLRPRSSAHPPRGDRVRGRRVGRPRTPETSPHFSRSPRRAARRSSSHARRSVLPPRATAVERGPRRADDGPASRSRRRSGRQAPRRSPRPTRQRYQSSRTSPLPSPCPLAVAAEGWRLRRSGDLDDVPAGRTPRDRRGDAVYIYARVGGGT